MKKELPATCASAMRSAGALNPLLRQIYGQANYWRVNLAHLEHLSSNRHLFYDRG